MIFFCLVRLRDFFVPRGSMTFFLSKETPGFFFYPERFCPKRLNDLFVSKVCMIYCCPERLGDLFLVQEVVGFFFVRRGFVIFFLSQEVV